MAGFGYTVLGFGSGGLPKVEYSMDFYIVAGGGGGSGPKGGGGGGGGSRAFSSQSLFTGDVGTVTVGGGGQLGTAPQAQISAAGFLVMRTFTVHSKKGRRCGSYDVSR